jgi:hypothetical protein
MRRFVPVLAALLVLAGCTALAPVVCEEPQFDPPGRLTCETAAAAAREALASTPGVARLEVLWVACPADARCVAPDGSSATVIATRSGPGDVLAVFVTIGEDGVARGELPQPVVPSEVPAGG